MIYCLISIHGFNFTNAMAPKDNSRLKPLMQSQNLSPNKVLWESKIESWNAPRNGLQQKLNGLWNVLGICIKIYYSIIYELTKACLCRIEEHTYLRMWWQVFLIRNSKDSKTLDMLQKARDSHTTQWCKFHYVKFNQ